MPKARDLRLSLIAAALSLCAYAGYAQETQAPTQPMAADADPTFEVATIKPTTSTALTLQSLNQRGRYFETVNSSLLDLIKFAYDLNEHQILNTPDWIDKTRFDISAVPSQDGVPSVRQVRQMLRQLLTARFHLTFHRNQRELPAFVLSLGTKAPQLTPTRYPGTIPNNIMPPAPNGWTLTMHNTTIGGLCGWLQTIVFDRPVVDHTGIAGNYDLSITFTPDDTQFHGHPPPVRPSETGETAPGLLDAINQQLGLRLDSKKALVDVLVIDHAEKPTTN
jgi:uncharacterized protein (TIGR03435 family)